MSRTNIVLVALTAASLGALAMFMLNPATDNIGEGAVRTIVGQAFDERDAKAAQMAANVDDAQQEISETAQNSSNALNPELLNPEILNPEILNPMIEEFLMSNPKILQRVSVALQEQLRLDEIAEAKVSLVNFEAEIYDDPDHVVLGNPEGDVTLV